MAKIISFELSGDKSEFNTFTNHILFARVLDEEIRRGTIKNSLFLLAQIKKTIRDSKFQKNAALTLALTKGTIPLLKQKHLIDAMSHKLKSSFESEVGFIRNPNSTGGVTGKTIKIKKLVELMHSGYTVKITPKMIAAIAAALRKNKGSRGSIGKRAKAARSAFSDATGAGQTIYRVPARKFMEKVFEDPKVEQTIQQNWREALERAWRRMGAKGGEHKDR